MFTGIIEALGEVAERREDGSNIHLAITSPISSELKIDQSVAHNGVCLTVVAVDNNAHTVTAVKETLDRSNLKTLKLGSKINLERCVMASSRLDGHIVQGHVDTTATVKDIREEEGSWYFTFVLKGEKRPLLVDKGSIAVNGVSLTVVKASDDGFSVAIIPYTFENTIFSTLRKDDEVNIEFDILGKYIHKYMEAYRSALAR